jgi:hypothetical protein
MAALIDESSRSVAAIRPSPGNVCIRAGREASTLSRQHQSGLDESLGRVSGSCLRTALAGDWRSALLTARPHGSPRAAASLRCSPKPTLRPQRGPQLRLPMRLRLGRDRPHGGPVNLQDNGLAGYCDLYGMKGNCGASGCGVRLRAKGKPADSHVATVLRVTAFRGHSGPIKGT